MQITITLADQTKKIFPKDITCLSIAQSISDKLAQKILVASVNDTLWDIERPITQDATVKLFTWDDAEGKNTFWHSSAHLMAEALLHFYPKAKLGIGPPIAQGFYYDIDFGKETFDIQNFAAIEKKMLALASQKNIFSRKNISKKEAIQYFEKKKEKYKLELLKNLQDGQITLYTQGNFTDLCKGPHIPHTGSIKAIKLLNVAGAYWQGNEKNQQLTRLYAITFPQKKELQNYLTVLEEAKKRDHRTIGKNLKLFTFSQKVGMGLPLWLPKGAVLREKLIKFLTKAQNERGYSPVVTPHIAKKDLYVTSGHDAKYGADAFQPIKTPHDELFMLKPMNCPHHCEIYQSEPRSYKELPIRLSEFGTVYRYEQHGELHGLTRVRGFTQDDAHIFCRPDQVKEEFKKVIDLVLYIFDKLKFQNFTAQISLHDPQHPEKYIGKTANWLQAEAAIQQAAQEKYLETTTKLGEAAFYGPKLDFMVKDAIGRSWQMGTVQLDYQLPEKFQLTYTGKDNTKHRPVMIHRAPFGSLERFIAILIEHTAGNFPLWLAPTPVIVLTVSEKYNEYAQKVCTALKKQQIDANLDDRNEKIGKKIREAAIQKIPYMLIIGEKETKDHTVAVRKKGEGDVGSMELHFFVKKLQEEFYIY